MQSSSSSLSNFPPCNNNTALHSCNDNEGTPLLSFVSSSLSGGSKKKKKSRSRTEYHPRRRGFEGCDDDDDDDEEVGPDADADADAALSRVDHGHDDHGHTASDRDTMFNQMKTCMGTGTLALSYACQQAGLVLYVLGLMGIVLWNVQSTARLVQCLDYCDFTMEEQQPYDAYEYEQLNRMHKNELQNPSVPQEEDPYHHPKDQSSSSNSNNCSSYNAELDMNTTTNGIHSGTSTCTTTITTTTTTTMSTLGRVAYCAFGPTGLQLLDAMMLLLFHGVIMSYISACMSFLAATPYSLDTNNAWLIASLMWILSLVPHVGYLSRASALGLCVLLATFFVIGMYGIVGLYYDDSTATATATPDTMTIMRIPFGPHSVSGVAQCFGVVVFSMGTVPLTYHFQSSMQTPSHIVPVTRTALTRVALWYIVLGSALLCIFPQLQGDVLSVLPIQSSTTNTTSSTTTTVSSLLSSSSSSSSGPSGGVFLLLQRLSLSLPVFVRISMTLVVLVTAPLLIVPCAQVLESKVSSLSSFVCNFPNSSSDHHHHDDWGVWMRRAASCACICGICATVAQTVPSFVAMVSIVGSACVGTVGLVVPFLLHYRLVQKQSKPKQPRQHPRTSSHYIPLAAPTANTTTVTTTTTNATAATTTLTAVVDLVMLVLGVMATTLATGVLIADSSAV